MVDSITSFSNLDDIVLKYLYNRFRYKPNEVSTSIESYTNPDTGKNYFNIKYRYKKTHDTMFVVVIRKFRTEGNYSSMLHDIKVIGLQDYNRKYVKDLTKVLTGTFDLTGLEICDILEPVDE